jgi:hypothetical protein
LLARRLDLSTSPSRQDQRSQKLPTAQITILRGRRSEACSTTLRFFRYSTEALSSASRGASTINQRSKRHDQLSSGVSTARGHKNSPTFVEPPRPHESSVVAYATSDSSVRVIGLSSTVVRWARNLPAAVRNPRIVTIAAPRSRVQVLCCLVRRSTDGVEPRGFEPLTSALQRRRSPN